MKSNHAAGQYRAQLFDELVAALLAAEFPDAIIRRNVIVPRTEPLRIDFVVREPRGRMTLVETRAPYSDPRTGLEDALRRVGRKFAAFGPAREVIFILADDLPVDGSVKLLLPPGGSLWDAAEVKRRAKQLLGFELKSLSTEALEAALTACGIPLPRPRPAVEEQSVLLAETRGRDRVRALIEEGKRAATIGKPSFRTAESFEKLRDGVHENTLALVADFCSFSRFVQASADRSDLAPSIMGRFYRESRRIISSHKGVLDKFMGDGLLAYWFPRRDGVKDFVTCVEELIGMGLRLGDEWQDAIDAHVDVKGMRAGAAIGQLVIVSESPDGGPPAHAIGECINVASRLQSVAEPNSLVISNRLHSEHLRTGFDEMAPIELKNIGTQKAWKRLIGG